MRFWRIAAALLVLLLTNCAAPKPDFHVRQAIKDKPLVYLYETVDNDRGSCKIIYQGKHLVTLISNTYFVQIPEAGELSYIIPRPGEVADEIDNGLTLGMVKDQQVFSTTFEARNGCIYYFKVQGLYLTRVDEAMALADLSMCHSIKQ
jgi:hypothetical protein